TLKDSRFRIGNSRFVAHHLGVAGTAFKDMPYKFMTSFSVNYGAKGAHYEESETILSTYLDVRVWRGYMDYNVQIGGDFSSASDPNLGIGIHLSRNIF